MTDRWTVFAALRQMTDIPESERAQATAVCDAALAETRARLRRGADETDPRFIRAAAATALYRLALKKSMDDADIAEFRAGDVKVRRDADSLIKTAATVRDEAEAAAAALFADTRFWFRGVRG
jgi:hypothetical protein